MSQQTGSCPGSVMVRQGVTNIPPWLLEGFARHSTPSKKGGRAHGAPRRPTRYWRRASGDNEKKGHRSTYHAVTPVPAPASSFRGGSLAIHLPLVEVGSANRRQETSSIARNPESSKGS